MIPAKADTAANRGAFMGIENASASVSSGTTEALASVNGMNGYFLVREQRGFSLHDDRQTDWRSIGLSQGEKTL